VADVPHGARTTQKRCGNFLVRALLALTAVAQKQDTRSGLFAGRSVAAVNQLLKFRAFVLIQFDMYVFAHVDQYTSMKQICKI
jgi:hypothetical protein